MFLLECSLLPTTYLKKKLNFFNARSTKSCYTNRPNWPVDLWLTNIICKSIDYRNLEKGIKKCRDQWIRAIRMIDWYFYDFYHASMVFYDDWNDHIRLLFMLIIVFLFNWGKQYSFIFLSSCNMSLHTFCGNCSREAIWAVAKAPHGDRLRIHLQWYTNIKFLAKNTT